MKKIILIILIIILVVLFGTFPLSILSKIFSFIAGLFEKLAKILNICGWNGLI